VTEDQIAEQYNLDRAAELAAFDKLIAERVEEYTALRYLQKLVTKMQHGEDAPEWATHLGTALRPFRKVSK